MGEDERQRFLDRVQDECIRARRKFPPFHSTHEAYAVILEEVDELWAAIKANEPAERLREELVQIAAMCACFAKEMRGGARDAGG